MSIAQIYLAQLFYCSFIAGVVTTSLQERQNDPPTFRLNVIVSREVICPGLKTRRMMTRQRRYRDETFKTTHRLRLKTVSRPRLGYNPASVILQC